MSETLRVKQHIPNFVDCGPPIEATVQSRDAVLDVPFVARWADDIDFDRWEWADYYDSKLLMARLRTGERWVVAYVTEETPNANP